MCICNILELNVCVNYNVYLTNLRSVASRIDSLREANQLKPKSRFCSWKPVTLEEMRTFFAIILNMGLIDILTLEGYWSTSWESTIPFF